MASFSTNEFKPGLKVILDGDPCSILENEYVKPGKGQAFTRTKMRNMLTGGTIERNIRSGEKLEPADVEDRTLQYIYADGDAYVFMNSQSGDQVSVQKEVVGDAAERVDQRSFDGSGLCDLGHGLPA